MAKLAVEDFPTLVEVQDLLEATNKGMNFRGLL